MKILVVSDEECKALWDYYTPGRLSGYDLILSCGDLKPEYLSFLVTAARCPLLYVHGNHDGVYAERTPEGCDCIDEEIVTYRGIRILGLGGCPRYSPGPHQYTEAQMRRSIRRLSPALHALGGVDIVVTHSSIAGLAGEESYSHRGFRCFRELMDRYTPRYWVHGHVHLNYGSTPRTIQYGSTTVVNAYERYTLEIPDAPYPEKHRYTVLRGKTRLLRNTLSRLQALLAAL